MNFTKMILILQESLNLRILHFNIVEPILDFEPIFAIDPPLLFSDPSVSILTSSDRIRTGGIGRNGLQTERFQFRRPWFEVICNYIFQDAPSKLIYYDICSIKLKDTLTCIKYKLQNSRLSPNNRFEKTFQTFQLSQLCSGR